jgi:hypothetical protein
VRLVLVSTGTLCMSLRFWACPHARIALGDHLGSVRDVVDKYGTVRIHQVHNAYGNITSQELRNSGNQPVQPG